MKSVQPFSGNVADKERKKERKKSPENKTLSPYRGRCNKITVYATVLYGISIYQMTSELPQRFSWNYVHSDL